MCLLCVATIVTGDSDIVTQYEAWAWAISHTGTVHVHKSWKWINIRAVLRVSAHLDRQLLRNLDPKKYFITSVFPPLPESCAIDNYLYTVLSTYQSSAAGWEDWQNSLSNFQHSWIFLSSIIPLLWHIFISSLLRVYIIQWSTEYLGSLISSVSIDTEYYFQHWLILKTVWHNI